MNPVIVLGIVAGFWIVPTMARFSPVIVNGFLVLLLVGIIFGNADRWLPILDAFGKAIEEGAGRKAGREVPAPPVGHPGPI